MFLLLINLATVSSFTHTVLKHKEQAKRGLFTSDSKYNICSFICYPLLCRGGMEPILAT